MRTSLGFTAILIVFWTNTTLGQSRSFPHFDLETIPFSRSGSFYTITKTHGNEHGELSIKTALRGAITYRWDGSPSWAHDFFGIQLFEDGTQVHYTTEVTPWELILVPESGSGEVKITFSGTTRLLFQNKGVELHLTCRRPPKGAWDNQEHELGFHLRHAQAMAQFKTYDGSQPLLTDDNHVVISPGSNLALWLPEYEKAWEDDLPNYEESRRDLKQEVNGWMAKMLPVPSEYENSAKVAWYLMWDLTVPAQGNYSRPGILMSKRTMNQIWAWDNCINSLPIASADPQLAWDQLLIFFDKQTATGMIPDPINDYQNQYAYTKPPLYGWAALKMIEMNGEKASLPYVKELYGPLVKYTEWWFKFRDTDNNGLCEYYDGVDGGWDNATVYDQGMPAEGPDLAAHLALQMEGLSKMAEMLGKKKEANAWKKRSQDHIALMLARCKTLNNTLLTPLRGQPINKVPQKDCLINYIPLELGDRLPDDVRTAMLPAVSPGGKFMTDWGLATQNPTSPKYEPDGYWRGPIWSPSTLLIFDGLVKAGEKELAREIAERFIRLCAQDNGFYENYNAVTGEGLRDKGYSWTAAGFLVMANWLHNHQTKD